ncbi:hypothetical protein Sjap_016696 [Stephania japonica]|uniref:Metallo-beta-lactamase domain-containing protein n=1 Tax=Stephania japonica TaxID=461633 RepID=A0AAP0ILG3_9MAGN
MENFTDEEEAISVDEEGFPSLQLPSEKDGSIEVAEDSFASDFYRCGTDWSCLVETTDKSSENHSHHHHQKKLKQTNLFQMWGFNKVEDTNVDSTSALRSPNEANAIYNTKKKNNSKRPMLGSIHQNDKENHNAPRLGPAMNPRIGDSKRRACPFYKKIPGTTFTVDAFRYGLIEGCSSYFLSHFHYDHYGGLSKGWSHGPIYCSPITARLVRMCLLVNPSFIRPLELDIEYVIEGVKVVLLEANHCPGATLILFHLADGRCYLHTGDFRASKMMQSHPLLANQHINVLYLDTTYCNPKYKFPSKEDVLEFVVKISRNYIKNQPKTLIVVGAYSIGKECVYLAISKALGVKIYANASRRRVLHSFGWSELSGGLCSRGEDTPLHVLPISSLRHETLKKYSETYKRQYTAVLAFRPTGWTYSETTGNQLDLIKPNSRGNITIYGVPYSEHSSFLELREFVQFLKADKIIPTVNIGTSANRDKMQSYFQNWLRLKDS